MAAAAGFPAPAGTVYGGVGTFDIGGGGGGGGGGVIQLPSSSLMNSQRITYLAQKLAELIDAGYEGHFTDLFRHLCLELARGIDTAVANNDVPSKAQELPILLKKVCKNNNDVLQTAIMVLMISVKIACKLEWFSKRDTEELLTLAKEIGSRFCSPGDINSEPSQSLPVVLKVMARFCPQMKTGRTLASLEVKSGYGAYLVDFHISKNQGFSSKDAIWLFVAQTDNIETSSCIIRPPQVNFLLNGRGVPQKRTEDNLLITGPQFPTNVTSLCIMGANLLQVVGQFNGNYLIVIASMRVTSTPEAPVLQDYAQPEVTAHDPDSEIIEGSSRIRLNCPISGKRIKTPVKGHSCKHHQCFDLDNYVKINMSNPFWRCPCCNQTISYLDIRIDQYMVKVLKEVGESVAYVTIFEDGSWKGGSESNEHVGRPSVNTSSCQQDLFDPQKPTSCSDNLPMIFDLTTGNDEMDLMSNCENEDRKHFQANPRSSIATTLHMQSEMNNTSANLPSHSIAATITRQLEMNNTSQIINQASIPQLEDDFWSGFSLPTFARSNVQNVGGIAEPFLASNMISPVLSDAVSPTLIREAEELRGNTLSVMQSQFSAPSSLQLQLSQVAQSNLSNEYRTFSSIPRHVSRTTIASQVLPVQSLQSIPQQRSWSPTAEGFNTISSDTQRQQQSSRSFISPLQVSEMASSSLPHHSMAQNRNHQDHLFNPSQLSGLYSQSYRVRAAHQNSHQPQAMNQRNSQSVTPPPNFRQHPYLQRTSTEQVGSGPWLSTTAGSGNRFIAASPQAIQMARPSQQSSVHSQVTRTGASLPINHNGLRASAWEQRGNFGGTVQPVTTAEALLDLSSEQNWRPTGQMRGSLLGQAYSAALSQFVTQPTQQTQGTRPPANPTSLQPVVLSQLPVLLANNRNAHSGQTPNYPMNELDGIVGSLDVLSDRS